ncbi:MAG: RluA family pseudouridine synthase [Bacillaceae bacterium]|nr:RluA family pseudouridine synthase [Bacillaceae bacterium]
MDRFTLSTIAKESKLLRDYLRTDLQISRQALTDIKANGRIEVNGESVTVRYLVQKRDKITVVFPQEERGQGLEPQPIPLSIVYEDDFLLVVDKQSNLPTIPSRYQLGYSLANAVMHYYDQKGIKSTFHAVNRLDKDTSGLLIIAKHRYAHDLFSRQQKNHDLKRTYLAIVHGIICQDKGTIDLPIGRKSDSIIEREVRSSGQRAITHFEVISSDRENSLVKLTLETGRTHQIRVHMASVGHPLLGDDLYGGGLNKINRQALHSAELTFFHPFLKKTMTFNSALPKDMKKIL